MTNQMGHSFLEGSLEIKCLLQHISYVEEDENPDLGNWWCCEKFFVSFGIDNALKQSF